MTRIKFRAWYKEENRILQGEPNFVNQHFYENENSKFPNLGTDFRVLQLMQFAGLLDKNGKEIYEGDVIYIAGYGDYEVQFPFIELYSAQMENDIGEIKGNIYENPELISNQ